MRAPELACAHAAVAVELQAVVIAQRPAELQAALLARPRGQRRTFRLVPASEALRSHRSSPHTRLARLGHGGEIASVCVEAAQCLKSTVQCQGLTERKAKLAKLIYSYDMRNLLA